ncbi:response regulator [Pseudomonas sp. CCM 7893]|uniref:Response regulator n=1 Tax=Pseudomonas spelaei TaxID=1055469 RepID=A0A6I3WKK3_9PSED|nr:response regulator transcription factor [Pseudomonas spelaei]MUF08264.1 response regulator [Pseudomonas spelaei]
MEQISVVIADDHPIILSGVAFILSNKSQYKVTGTAQSSTELICLLREKLPDILICDYNMPGDNVYGDGMRLFEYILRSFPRVKIIVLTMVSMHSIISRLYDIGVRAVVYKGQEPREILNVLERVRSGGICGVKTSLSFTSSGCDAFSKLTKKEIEVVRHFLCGISVCEIALILRRSVKTVSTQKRSAMIKLNVATDQELVMLNMQKELS